MLGMRDSKGSVSLSSLFSAGKHTDKRFPIISGSTGNGILTTSAHNGKIRHMTLHSYEKNNKHYIHLYFESDDLPLISQIFISIFILC